MNGPQDVGGRDGFGAVVGPGAPANPPHFHADWEARVLGITLACGVLGHWNIDSSRHARESLPVPLYYTATYYEIWLRALERLLERAGEVSAAERAEAAALSPPRHAERCLRADRVDAVLAAGSPVDRPAPAPARFAVGDRVRTRNHQPQGHTRLPAYAREKTGVVETVHGAHVFPDTNAHGAGEAPTWLYTVTFDGSTVFGDAAEPGLTVSIDAWEPYLERA